MRFFWRTIVILALAGALIAAGIWLPEAFHRALAQLPASWKFPSSPSVEAVTDSLAASPLDTVGDAWDRKLFHPLQRQFQIPDANIKRHPGKARLLFPKGLPIHEYAYQLETACSRNGIALVEAREVRQLNKATGATYLLALGGDTLQVTATLGRGSLAGSIRIAVVFTDLDSLSIADAALLHAAGFICNLILDPYNPNPALKALQSEGSRLHFLAEIPLEPMAYPYVNPGKHAIYLHFSEEEVKKTLDAAFALLPGAVGMATRYGDRVIENRISMLRIFNDLKDRDLPLLDLTQSPRSLARDIAAETGGRCYRSAIFPENGDLAMEFARKTVAAAKTGEGLLVLPFSRRHFAELEKLMVDREDEFESMGLTLVPFSQLNAPPLPE